MPKDFSKAMQEHRANSGSLPAYETPEQFLADQQFGLSNISNTTAFANAAKDNVFYQSMASQERFERSFMHAVSAGTGGEPKSVSEIFTPEIDKKDPEWNPFDELENANVPREFWAELIDTNNKLHFDKRLADIERISQEKLLASKEGGAALAGSLVSGILSPETALALTPAAGGRLLAIGRGGPKTSLSTLRKFGESTAGGTGGAVVDEYLLQQVDPTRTADESMNNILGGAMFATTLGGAGIGYVKTRDMYKAHTEGVGSKMRDEMKAMSGFRDDPLREKSDAFQKSSETSLSGENADDLMDSIREDMGGSSVGAAKYFSYETLRDDAGLANMEKLGKVFRITNPILDGIQAKGLRARELTSELWEHNFLLGKNLRGEVTPDSVHTNIGLHRGKADAGADAIKGAYGEYVERMLREQRGSKPLTFTEFKNQIAELKFSRVRDPNADALPEVHKAANDMDRLVFDAMAEEGHKVGLLKKKLDAKKYFPVFYLRDVIMREGSAFKKDLQAEIKNTIERSKREVNVIEAAGKKAPKELRDIASIPDKDIEGISDGYFNNIVNDEEIPVDVDAFKDGKSSRYKGRILPLDYSTLSRYVDTDVDNVMSLYVRNTSPDIELYRKYGSIHMKNEINDLIDEYNDLARKAKNEAERDSILKEKERMVDNITFARDTLRNRTAFSMSSEGVRKAVKTVNAVTFMRSMGMFMISSIGELAMPILVHGFKNTYGPYMKNFKSSLEGVKMSKAEAKRLGIAVDANMSTRLMQMLDPGESRTKNTTYEQRVDHLTGRFAKLFGIPWYNDTIRTMSMNWNNSILAKKIDGITDGFDTADATDLANLGISQDWARVMRDELSKHGEVVEGTFVPNTAKWGDSEAARLYEAALMKSVNNEIVMPSPGDLPKVAQTAPGKIAFFLRSYTFAINNRGFLANVQRANMQKVNALGAVLAMGVLSHVLYEKSKGREVDWSMDSLIYNGIDRSGLLGLGWELNNMSDKITGVGFGDGDKFKHSTNPLVELMGPNGYTAEDLADLGLDPSFGDAWSFVPGNNFVGLEVMSTILKGDGSDN